MSTGLKDVLTIIGVAVLVFFTNLGSYPLFDEDEPKNAVCGKEMFARGDWIVPTFNEELRTDKPILIYWLMLTSFNLFGVSEFAARFGSSVLSVGTCLGTYYLGRKLYDRQVGLLAGIVVATCLMFSAVGRAVTPDATLVCCLTWVFCFFVMSRNQPAARARDDKSKPLAGAAGWWIAMYAMMGFAMLAKGPVGFVLPCMAIGLFGLCSSVRDDLAAGVVTLGDGRCWRKTMRMALLIASPARFFRTLWSMKLWIGVPVAFGIALPWYIAVGFQTNGEWPLGFLVKHNLERATTAMENHRGLFIYYIPVLFAGTFPWSVFLPSAVMSVWRRVRDRAERSDGDLFLACWAVVWLALFSAAQTKLPNYILPIYPAVAIMLSRSLISWMRELAVGERRFLWECRALASIGGLMVVGLLMAMTILLPNEQALALFGVIPMAAGGCAYYFARHQQRERAVLSLAGGAIMLCVGMMGFAPVQIARYQDSPFFAAAARDASPFGNAEIASFDVFEPSLVYYHGRKVHRPGEADHVAQYFADYPEGFLLTRSDKLHRLPTELTDGLVEVARQKRFLRRHDLVLLSKPTVLAAGHRETQ